MTDLDQPSIETASAPAEPADPARPGRRGGRARWWWVAAVVVAGALLGMGLAKLDSRHSKTQAIGATITSLGDSPKVPEGLVGNSSGHTAKSTPPPIHAIDNRVFVVGDSVMQGAAPYLSLNLPNWSVIADTKVGRFLDQANTVITKRHKDIGKIVVLNLGNNYNGSQTQFAQQVATTMTELAGVEHIIWVNVAEFKDDRVQVNQVLQQAADTHPNVTIVDWNSWWAANPDFTGADHLHLTDDGARAYASLVGAAVDKVTKAAGEIPAPGIAKPSLNTSGTIPGSGRSRTTVATSRTRTTVHHYSPPTTRPAPSATAPTPVVTTPPATTPAPVDTAPKTTTPVTSAGPVTTVPHATP